MKADCSGAGPSGAPVCGMPRNPREGASSWQPGRFFLLKEGPEARGRSSCSKLDPWTLNVRVHENNNYSCYLGRSLEGENQNKAMIF